MSTLIIRRAKPEDFAAIWPIFHAVVASGETYAYDPATPYEAAQALWLGGPGVQAWVALSGEEVVGTYRVGPNQPGLGDHVANAAYMVAPAARGQGIGRALVEHSFERARAQGFRSMVFNLVVATNHGAIALWQSVGFRIVGTLHGAYRHARLGLVDAHIMQRSLLDLGGPE
jgi:L-amino acid N-acyltransferase YncA